MAMNVEDGVFKLPIQITENGEVKKVLLTQDTYVDKNIEVVVETPDAELEVKEAGVVTAVVSTTDTTYTSDTVTPYAITIAADASVTDVKTGVKTAGFAAATDTVTVAGSDAEQNTKTIYVKEGTLGGDGEASATGNIQLTQVGAAPTDGSFYIKASGAGEVGVATAGWVDPDKTAKVTTDGDSFYKVKAATLSNNETGDFTEIDAPVLTEDGYLFINEGYIAPTKISLATLVPDDANITTTNADKVYNTVTAYDKDGKLIVGTMGDAELGNITADDATATISTLTVAKDGAAFKVTGTGDISGNASVAISKRGLAETDLTQDGVIAGTATVNATLAKVGLTATADDDDVEVTPVISKNDATTASSGEITTTAPEGHFVAVDTAAIAASATVSPSVATEGYGTADAFDATDVEVKAGAAASGVYYIPITEASHSVTKTVSEVGAPVTTVETAVNGGDVTPVVVAEASKVEGKQYVKIAASAQTTDGYVQTNATCTSTEGYITATTKDIVTRETVSVEDASATAKYIRVYGGEILEA